MSRLHYIVIALCLPIGLLAQSSYTLQQAIDHAVDNSYAAQQAELDVTISEEQKKETLGIGLPQVSATVGYQNFIDLPVSLVPAEFFGGQPGDFAELQFGTDHTANATITANQLVFDGSYIIALKSSEFYLEMTRDLAKRTEIDIIDQVTRAYYLALAATENMLILQDNVTNTEVMLQDMQLMFDNGFVEKTDVDQIQLMLSNVTMAYDNAVNQVIFTENLLKFQMGVPLEEEVTLTDDLYMLIDEIDYDLALQEFSPSDHIDFEVVANNEYAMELLYKLEKMKYLPSLGAYFQHQQNSFSNSFDFFDNKWFPTNVWGVNINVPIFSGFSRNARVSRAELEWNKATLMKEQVEESLRLQADQTRNDFMFARSNYDTQLQNLELARNIKETTYIKYQEGQASSLDLAQAENQVLQTETTYIQSIIQLINAKADLDKSLNNYETQQED